MKLIPTYNNLKRIAYPLATSCFCILSATLVGRVTIASKTAGPLSLVTAPQLKKTIDSQDDI